MKLTVYDYFMTKKIRELHFRAFAFGYSKSYELKYQAFVDRVIKKTPN